MNPAPIYFSLWEIVQMPGQQFVFGASNATHTRSHMAWPSYECECVQLFKCAVTTVQKKHIQLERNLTKSQRIYNSLLSKQYILRVYKNLLLYDVIFYIFVAFRYIKV